MTSFCHLLHVLSKTILVRFEAVIPGKGEVLTKKIFKFTKKIILTKLRFWEIILNDPNYILRLTFKSTTLPALIYLFKNNSTQNSIPPLFNWLSRPRMFWSKKKKSWNLCDYYVATKNKQFF